MPSVWWWAAVGSAARYAGNGTTLQRWDLYPRQRERPGWPLFVGGCELVGGSGTGTFTQNSGTNAIIGGGSVAVSQA